ALVSSLVATEATTTVKQPKLTAAKSPSESSTAGMKGLQYLNSGNTFSRAKAMKSNSNMQTQLQRSQASSPVTTTWSWMAGFQLHTRTTSKNMATIWKISACGMRKPS